jgi:hypothetical protein
MTNEEEKAPEAASGLKLFVWEGFESDWTDGLAFAIAKDETEARAMVEKERGYSPRDWGTLTIYPLNRAIAKAVGGGG